MRFRKPPEPLPEATWAVVRDAFPVLAGLDVEPAGRLRTLAGAFLREKSVEPVQGLEMDADARAAVAALACLPVLELGLAAYDGWTSVIVYPGGFVTRGHDVDEAGVVHEFEEARSGESWLQGPVILSWEDVAASGQRDGYNVVIHEMAHKLDMLNGDANGFPPLGAGLDEVGWHRDMSAAFDDLNERLDHGRRCPIDEYAAETPGEFFAVASEYFFELPGVLEDAYPNVYRRLAAFYRQDPGAPFRRRGL
jgi:Mlc titration factor MtfA (ptsG expression regulator)